MTNTYLDHNPSAPFGHFFHSDVKDDLVNDVEEELADLDALSDKSSLCDCPAHVHDRETPLEIDKVRIGWTVLNKRRPF